MATPITTLAATTPPITTNNLGRDKVGWSKDVWDRIDMAVHDEAVRTKVAAKFIPLRPVAPRTLTVPSDLVVPPGAPQKTLTVDEGAATRLIEIWVEFALTPQQVEQETSDTDGTGHSTAMTLATRASNILSQAEDLLIFQGQNALKYHLIETYVRHRGDPADLGLLLISLGGGAPLPAAQVIPVQPDKGVYGERTFAAVAQGYSVLQGNGQYGPYALVLQTRPYADSYAPLAKTLIMPADRIKSLVTAGFYGTGTLPAEVNRGYPPGPKRNSPARWFPWAETAWTWL
jgi:uncharacterized linocin/CFP29 family protein